MFQTKTTPSAIDRRRFLQHTWRGVEREPVAGRCPGPICSRGPASATTRSRSASRPAIRRRTASCCGRASRRSPPIRRALGRRGVPVGWRVATDSRMRQVVARGVALAPAELAHSVHVEVERPAAGPRLLLSVRRARRGERDRPLPDRAARRTSSLRELRFAFATCQDWPSGYYTAYRDMLQHDLDLVLHLGDYTYEYRDRRDTGRGVSVHPRVRGGDRRPAHLSPAPHAVQARSRSAGRAREVSVRRHLGRSRGRTTTTRAWRRSTARRRRSSRPDAPRPIRRTTSTCRSGFAVARSPRRGCASTAGCATARSPSSRCSTIGSTARTIRAATASRCAARRR